MPEEAEAEDLKLGELVDAIVCEVLGQRQTPGSPTLAKKEALAILEFVRMAKRLGKKMIEITTEGVRA